MLEQPPMGLGFGSGLTDVRQRNPYLGLNLVSNPTFIGIGGWTSVGASLGALTNILSVTLALGIGSAWQDVAVEAGQWYRISVMGQIVTAAQATLEVYPGGGFTPMLDSAVFNTGVMTSAYVDVFASGSSLRVNLSASGSVLNVASFSNAQVRKILG